MLKIVLPIAAVDIERGWCPLTIKKYVWYKNGLIKKIHYSCVKSPEKNCLVIKPSGIGEASPTLGHANAHFSVFIDRILPQIPRSCIRPFFEAVE